MHGQVGIHLPDTVVFVLDVDTGRGQCRIIVRTERVEVFCINLCRTVSTQQVVLEENADFRYHGSSVRMFCSGYFDRSNQIFLSVCT